jgi:recombination protein RecA
MSGLVWSLEAAQNAPEAVGWLKPRTLAEQLPQGRLIEIIAHPHGGQMSTAVSCLVHAQQRGETSAWVQLKGGSLYPPDLAANGVDLAALVIVQAPKQTGAQGLGKATELLLRSGGFGFVVLDLVGVVMRHDLAFQGRLLGLTREHNSTLILLTSSRVQGSFGPLVSLCVEPMRVRLGPSRFVIQHNIRKDKLGLFNGPLGSEPVFEL